MWIYYKLESRKKQAAKIKRGFYNNLLKYPIGNCETSSKSWFQ